MLRTRRYALVSGIAAVVAALSACSHLAPPPAAPTAPVVAAAPDPRAALDALDMERRRLAALFSGTPVVFVTTSSGNLRATVPRRYCFDVGSAEVKPPLGAVLDRIAKSQASTTSRLHVTVPSDPGAKGLDLAGSRAASVRDRMVAQGIAPQRLQTQAASATEQVEVVASVLPPPP